MSFEPDPRHRRVVIDTNALYAMPLADTLLRAADGELFDFLWTADIMRELRATMLRAFRDTEVSGYEEIIPRLRLRTPTTGMCLPRLSTPMPGLSSPLTCGTSPLMCWPSTRSRR